MIPSKDPSTSPTVLVIITEPTEHPTDGPVDSAASGKGNGSSNSFSASLQSFQTSMMQPSDALYRKLINQAANAPSTAALLGDLTKFDTKDTISPKMVMKKTPSKGICNVEGCTRRIRSRGLCKSHGGKIQSISSVGFIILL